MQKEMKKLLPEMQKTYEYLVNSPQEQDKEAKNLLTFFTGETINFDESQN